MRHRPAPWVLLLILACRGQELPTSPGASAPAVVVTETTPPIPAPSVHSVTPSIGRPAGGETVRIHGSNFMAPARVLFDIGDGKTEAFVIGMQSTMIDVLTPAVLMGNAQRREATLHVILRAGTEHEVTVTAERAFIFQRENLQPSILTLSPNRAPATGGTRATIFGEGFQQPVQVLVEQQEQLREARIYQVDYSHIVLELPPGRIGSAGLIVRNIHSGGEARLANALQYVPPIQVTAISPTLGPATGGTNVRITGAGFVAPVIVTIGGIPAIVLSVAPTEIVARTTAAGCNDDGPVQVTNVHDGDTTTGPLFEYRCPKRRAA